MATVIYYDVFDFPLTFAEVYKYLVNPKRLSLNLNQERFNLNECNECNAIDIAEELEKMAKAGIIDHKNGFYFMPGREGLYEKRIEKDKLAGKKWKIFLRMAKYLQVAPYLRAVLVSGSLAANNSEPKSDFDVFIVIKSGRLYTGRLFLWLISSVLGVRRGRFDVIAPDKLCFNHYITDDNLELTHRSLYIAQSLANMKPVIIAGGILEKFVASNRWANSYCYNFRPATIYRNVRTNKVLLALAGTEEAVLNNFLGDLLEKILRAFQQKRIKNNPATYESGGRIIFNDKELEFHPRSFERTVINNYNNKLKKAGISNILENESGLS
ncbi:MAG: hypothetical protein A2750_02295 [Candidatus Yanofskybacteria bacterium RIFCSPHIGHO2_01_FULL_45_42]|uniref:Polymerase nucleotidyl transferase domain-containing protein n=1 Tax=Candidatus Yanofskybacteria bacterium RIFCSPHIGHO2_01_FULL_45_42 TaxID=1802671 RepID=A0A1F8F1U2_9BACT|nr:MAG: hypothetical protein A2750_02295 [Candidatus Yanofskybacteria bacterium RIFCSPHIGHO2_01_FULL_45_42]